MGRLAPLRFATTIAILVFGLQCAAAACLNVSGTERLELRGELTYRVFPGPPNFADVKAGDSPEPAFLLALPRPVCVAGGDEAISTIELLPTKRTVAFMRSLVGSQVLVSLAKPIAAAAPHRHAPLAAAAVGIAELEGAPPELAATTPESDYASAAAIVRKFYQSLGQGDGDQAATLIAPGLRKGPLSAEEMSRFYSRLRDPLRLTELKQINPNRYFVSYTFRASSKACNGRAVVDVVNRSGENYISYIRALDGC
jgi:hypothetical protein